jgi:anti-sigma B factor antagonist
MDKLLFPERRGTSVVVLSVSGELDVLTAPQLDLRLTAVAGTGLRRVVLDTAEMTFCDASGIGVLIKARNRASRQQGWLRLIRVHPRIRRVLAIVGLTEVLPEFASVADAVGGTGLGTMIQPFTAPGPGFDGT